MRKLVWICCFVIIFTSPVRSQDSDKALSLFEDAIEAMGGEAFLNVRDMVSEGNYFIFNRYGDSSPLIKFKDYTKLPDKSRHELGNKKKELEITVFNLEKNEGWILEGQKETRDATPEEMREFHNIAKHSLDLLFRTRYKDPANRLFYFGPGEGRDFTLERVKLIDPENDEVTVYFDRMSKLPAKIEYSEVNQGGVRVRITQEFSQWHWIQDVRTSLRTDAYINGRQASQNFILAIEYNTDLPDSFFSKPVPPK
ncbi:MAG: hypothetical protein JXR49_10170 [Acidobacteria bacterium]|nr:hypothetical protein [Acidobacteriota bacterium]